MNALDLFEFQLKHTPPLNEQDIDKMIESRRNAGVLFDEALVRSWQGKKKLFFILNKPGLVEIIAAMEDEISQVAEQYEFVEMFNNMPRFNVKE